MLDTKIYHDETMIEVDREEESLLQNELIKRTAQMCALTFDIFCCATCNRLKSRYNGLR